MTILLLVTGLAAIAVPGLRPATLLRAHPRLYARLATVAVASGLACAVSALVLSVAVGLLHLEFGHLGGPDHLAPEGAAGAAIAAGTLLMIGVRAATLTGRSSRARRRATPDAWLGEHRRTASHDLTVLPTQEPVAFSIIDRGQTTVVISEGLQGTTDEATLRLVIEHELAHARSRDRRMLLLAQYLDAVAPVVPFAGRTSTAMRVAAERAADEAATGADPTPRSRLAAHLARHASTARTCAGECASYRAEQLRRAPSRAPASMAGAVGAMLILGVVAVAVLAHATSDIAPYLALLTG